jgi:hypothetical protein
MRHEKGPEIMARHENTVFPFSCPKSCPKSCFHAQNHAQRALVNDASRTKDELLQKVDNTNTTGANAQWARRRQF